MICILYKTSFIIDQKNGIPAIKNIFAPCRFLFKAKITTHDEYVESKRVNKFTNIIISLYTLTDVTIIANNVIPHSIIVPCKILSEKSSGNIECKNNTNTGTPK
jgi:hypothetical protein